MSETGEKRKHTSGQSKPCDSCAEKKRENPSYEIPAKTAKAETFSVRHHAGFEYCWNCARLKLADMERNMMNKRVDANTAADDAKAREKDFRKAKIAANRAVETAKFVKEKKEQFARAMGLIVTPVSETALIKFEKQLGLSGGSGNYSVEEVRKPGEGMGAEDARAVLKLITLGASSINFEFKSKGEEGFIMAVEEGKWKLHAECYPGTGETENFDALDFHLRAETEEFYASIDILLVDKDGKVKKNVKLLERDPTSKSVYAGGQYDLSLKDCNWTRRREDPATCELIEDYTVRFNVQLF